MYDNLDTFIRLMLVNVLFVDSPFWDKYDWFAMWCIMPLPIKNSLASVQD